jgi:benzoyl-CoA reductase/2-hydroxyglutaryl-CoA dehydratase subunit BcrC/BadD/HgdB
VSDSLRYTYEHPLESARAHSQAGGKVVGYVSTAVPSELIAASGALPVMIRGDVHRKTTLADEWMEEQFDPMARSIFDMALAGELQFLDLLIVPRVADSFMRLYLYLREVERLGLSKKLPPVFQFDLLQSQLPSTMAYNLERFSELSAALAKLMGRAITNDALRKAIADSNENRAVLRSVLVKRDTGAIRGSNALRAIGARYSLPMAEHTSHIKALLSSVTNTSANSAASMRIVVAGNAQDNTLLYELLEAQGFHIVGDYHWLGDNCCQHDIDIAGDPLESLARHYLDRSLTSRRYPLPVDEIVQVARNSRASGVVFFLFASEEALSWDSPNQVVALEKAGIPTLVMDYQPYGPRVGEELQEKLERFKSRVSS